MAISLPSELMQLNDQTRGERYAIGTKIGPYTLVQFLGRGAFGEVWLAERESALAKSRLAVKLPLPSTVDLNAIRREAHVWVAAGHHPNVLPMFEADIYGEQVVIVSEFAPSGSLEDWLGMHSGKAPSFEAAVEMLMAVLAGLEHLHVRGIIHRDLKPANVLMQGECPVLPTLVWHASFSMVRQQASRLVVQRTWLPKPSMAKGQFRPISGLRAYFFIRCSPAVCHSSPQA